MAAANQNSPRPQRVLSVLLLLLVAATSAAAGAHASGKLAECELNLVRLPDSFRPLAYDVALGAQLARREFYGSVRVRVRFGERQSLGRRVCSRLAGLAAGGCACLGLDGADQEALELCDRRIVMHLGDPLELQSIEVYKQTRGNSSSTTSGANLFQGACVDRRSQMLAITLSRRAQPGDEFQLELGFRGQMGATPANKTGFYLTEHNLDVTAGAAAAAGQQLVHHENANTHFFPADARSAFPCFDEPHLKARFRLRLTHDRALSAVSNARVESRQHFVELTTTRFAETPPMSSYNFAFAVGHYEQVRCARRPNVVAHVPLGRSRDVHFVLGVVCDAIGEAERYFAADDNDDGIPFPLDKLDLVVTRQMRDPARENWGLLVLSEEFLLTDADTSHVLREEIAKLAAHIVLHQWFGDLVTTRWWDDQWIFDGFTIWQSHWLADRLRPQLNYEANYLLRLQSAQLDAHAGTAGAGGAGGHHYPHPIKTYNSQLSANQELELFDANTYNKAGAIYHMLSSIDERAFRRALGAFVRKFAYGSAGASDFFAVLAESTGWPFVEPMLRSWLDQVGAPLVEVSHTSDASEAGGLMLEFTQSRLADQRDQANGSAGSDSGAYWIMPINYLVQAGDKQRRQQFMLTRRQVSRALSRHHLDLAQGPATSYVKLNCDFSGFYRVKYSRELLARLETPVRRRLLEPADRFNLLDDLRALYKLGYYSTSSAEDLEQLERVLSWYEHENHGLVFSGLASVLPVLREAHERQAAAGGGGGGFNRTQQVVFRLFERSVLDTYGFGEPDSGQHAQLNGRQEALMALVYYGHEGALAAALAKFARSDVHLAAHLRKPVYLAVANAGSEAQFGQLLERLRQTRSNYERQILVAGLLPYVGGEARAGRLRALLK